jgi:uncharacterized membrane protein HdeD (DUF308 family)
MSTGPQPSVHDPLTEELKTLRKTWLLFLLLGAASMLMGLLAIVVPHIATLATVAVVGALILVGGVVHMVSAFSARCWRGFVLHVLAGLLYVVVGLLLLNRPRTAATGLTVMMAAVFIIGGLFRIIVSMAERFHGWGWDLANGFITLLLGLLIWRMWREDEDILWVIGLFVGIDLLMSGTSWVMLALSVRYWAKTES